MDASTLRTRATSIGRDLRALGVGAPARAGLEASKRLGGHAALFGHLATATGDGRQGPPVPLVTLLPTAPADTVPDAARRRTLAAAATIAGGTVELFGQAVAVGTDPDWHATIDGPDRWPADPWWTIDIRSDVRTGDVKWVWELGRHHHLVVLARAAHLEPDGAWAGLLGAQLTSWLDANPPEMGIHWYSNLEIALRALAWLQILALAGHQLDLALVTRLEAVLHHSGRHLLADLPYTVSTMRNNHLVGDGLGLAVLGRAFPGDARARRWVAIGDQVLDRQLRTQLQADGSMIEDSVSYHRFVLEMLSARVLLAPRRRQPVGVAAPPERDALVRSARFLCRLGVLDGEVPRHGDGDEGRVLTSVGPVDDLAGSVLAALALAGHGSRDADRAEHDECAWYTAEGHPAAPDPAERDGHAVGGGIARAGRGPFTVWLKADGGPSHGHADLCSSPIRLGDDWVVGDPGTGTYNGPIAERTYFRSSIAHSVTRLEHLDQLEPHRAFRWRHPAVGTVGHPIPLPAATGGTGDGPGPSDDGVVLWGWHESYLRLDPPRRVVRAVIVETAAVTVADWVEGPPGATATVSFPLAPDTRVVSPGDGNATAAPVGPPVGPDVELRLPSGATATLRLPGPGRAIRGVDDPYDGWWSATYGAAEPAVRLEVETAVAGPLVWSVAPAARATEPPRAVSGPGPAARWQVDGDRLVGDGRSVGVRWCDTGPQLWVQGPDAGQGTDASG